MLWTSRGLAIDGVWYGNHALATVTSNRPNAPLSRNHFASPRRKVWIILGDPARSRSGPLIQPRQLGERLVLIIDMPLPFNSRSGLENQGANSLPTLCASFILANRPAKSGCILTRHSTPSHDSWEASCSWAVRILRKTASRSLARQIRESRRRAILIGSNKARLTAIVVGAGPREPLADGLAFSGGVQIGRNMHEPERNRSLPDGSHITNRSLKRN